jgi:hypothetical protein
LANSLSLQRPDIRLSGKEISGLAARVLVAGLVPPGAIGGAAEVVELLELIEGGALARLDEEKDTLADVAWRAPEVTAERADAAIADCGFVPAHFHGPALSDWLAAMVLETGEGSLRVSRVGVPVLLGAVPCLLAAQGIGSAVLLPGDKGLCRFRLALSKPGEWFVMTWPDGEVPAAVAGALAGDAAGLDGLRRFRASCHDVRAALEAGGPLPTVREWAMPSGDAFLAAFSAGAAASSLETASAIPGLRLTTSADLARLKAEALARGWPMDRPLWERLMAFADRSLIPTSERSRLGAG